MTNEDYEKLKVGDAVWLTGCRFLAFSCPAIVTQKTNNGCSIRVNLFGDGYLVWEPEIKQVFLDSVERFNKPMPKAPQIKYIPKEQRRKHSK